MSDTISEMYAPVSYGASNRSQQWSASMRRFLAFFAEFANSTEDLSEPSAPDSNSKALKRISSEFQNYSAHYTYLAQAEKARAISLLGVAAQQLLTTTFPDNDRAICDFIDVHFTDLSSNNEAALCSALRAYHVHTCQIKEMKIKMDLLWHAEDVELAVAVQWYLQTWPRASLHDDFLQAIMPKASDQLSVAVDLKHRDAYEDAMLRAKDGYQYYNRSIEEFLADALPGQTAPRSVGHAVIAILKQSHCNSGMRDALEEIKRISSKYCAAIRGAQDLASACTAARAKCLRRQADTTSGMLSLLDDDAQKEVFRHLDMMTCAALLLTCKSMQINFCLRMQSPHVEPFIAINNPDKLLQWFPLSDKNQLPVIARETGLTLTVALVTRLMDSSGNDAELCAPPSGSVAPGEASFQGMFEKSRPRALNMPTLEAVEGARCDVATDAVFDDAPGNMLDIQLMMCSENKEVDLLPFCDTPPYASTLSQKLQPHIGKVRTDAKTGRPCAAVFSISAKSLKQISSLFEQSHYDAKYTFKIKATLEHVDRTIKKTSLRLNSRSRPFLIRSRANCPRQARPKKARASADK